MSKLTLRLAETLHPALPRPRPATPSPYLARAIEAVVKAYDVGQIEVAESVFAVNFLPDMAARLRNVELALLRQRLGEGRLESVEPIHTLSGRFVMVCERGRLRGTIILSPDAEPGIQKVTLSAD